MKITKIHILILNIDDDEDVDIFAVGFVAVDIHHIL